MLRVDCSIMYTSLINLYITTLIAAAIHALPSGAPTCEVGKAAPMSSHLDISRNPTTGSLSSAGFIVKIDGFALDPNAINEISANKELKVVVTSDTGLRPFRGVLMILSKPGRTTVDIFSLSNAQATDLQINALCTNAGRSGVTHADNNVKTNITATMQFDENFDDLNFDVNVVVLNRSSGSLYYYTQYKLKVTGATPRPTRAPIPTRPPTRSPTIAPTRAPTRAPTVAPVSCRKCGLLGLGIFCPFTLCGLVGRLFYCRETC